MSEAFAKNDMTTEKVEMIMGTATTDLSTSIDVSKYNITLSINLTNQNASMMNYEHSNGADIESMELDTQIFDFEVEELRKLNKEELAEPIIHSNSIKMMSSVAKDMKPILFEESGVHDYFSLSMLLHVILETEKVARPQSKYFNSVDTTHVNLKSIDKAAHPDYDIVYTLQWE